MRMPLTSTAPVSPLRSWYAASIAEFLQAPPDQIVGHLTTNADFAVEPDQRDAWLTEIRLLSALEGQTGGGSRRTTSGNRVSIIRAIWWRHSQRASRSSFGRFAVNSLTMNSCGLD